MSPSQFRDTRVALAILVSSASAATLIDGSGITVTVNSINSTGSFPIQSVVDGTGLTAGVHGSGGNSEWYTSNGVSPANSWISFDLGASYVLDTVHVWNATQYVGFGIAQLDILVSTLATPGADAQGADSGDWTQIATDVFFASWSGTNTGFDLETQTGISLPTTAVRHVAFYSDTQIGGGNNYVGLAEVQFSQLCQNPLRPSWEHWECCSCFVVAAEPNFKFLKSILSYGMDSSQSMGWGSKVTDKNGM